MALWLLENGAELNPKANVREAANGRGIWSTGDLAKASEVARVPWKLLMTRRSAMEALGLSKERLNKNWGGRTYGCHDV